MRPVNVIALILFIAAMVWVFLFGNDTTRRWQRAVGSVFSPFTRTGAKVQEALTADPEAEKTPEQIKSERDAFIVELGRKRLVDEQNTKLARENVDLRAKLGFVQKNTFGLIPAQIINRRVSAWWRTALIDAGTDQLVVEETAVLTPVEMRDALDDPVIDDEGNPIYQGALVGRIGSTETNSSNVVLLTDERCRVAGKVQGRNVKGILSGSRSSIRKVPDLFLRFLPKDANVQVGDKVFSAGDGKVIPEDILLGTVVEFRPGELSAEAVVKPAVDFESLKYVFVMKLENAVEEIKRARPVSETEEDAP